MENFMGTLLFFFFILNPTFIHHPLLIVLNGQEINVNLFYDTNMLIKNEQCKEATMNPKAQGIFVHTIIHVIFKYILQMKKKKNIDMKTTILSCSIT
jgi:hypothetical protein